MDNSKYKNLSLISFLMDVNGFAGALYLDLDNGMVPDILYIDSYRERCNITEADNIDDAKAKIAFNVFWRVFKYRDDNIIQKIETFLREKFSLKIANSVRDQCIRAAVHNAMYNFARDLYISLGDNPSIILSKYRYTNYRVNCRVKPGDSQRKIFVKMANGIFWHAFTYHNKDIEQKIISFICNLLNPIDACLVYEVCMVRSNRGSIKRDSEKNQILTLSIDTSDSVMTIECKNILSVMSHS